MLINNACECFLFGRIWIAYDYILKESMEENNIIDLLERLKYKLDQEQYSNQNDIANKLIEMSTRNEDVLKAQKYVECHLKNKISLTEVAAHLHLNLVISAGCIRKKQEKALLNT
jgi:YesN/AraC family two-component response regulator